jgi:hypothetical protein
MLHEQTESESMSDKLSEAESVSGKKIFFGVLGGCLTAFFIVGLIIFGIIWWATPRVKEEIEKNKPKIEEWTKKLEKQAREAEEKKAREQIDNTQAPADDTPPETNQLIPIE